MHEIDHRPSNGGGTCPRCGAPLDLASVKRDGVWYCGVPCAEGRVSAAPREPAVPEPWLYARPRRFFRQRAPKELKGARPRP